MRRAAVLVLLPVLLCPGALAQAEQPPMERLQVGLFLIDVPAGWRKLGQGEALELAEVISPLIDPTDAQAGQQQIYGPVDAWRDGRRASSALLVASQPFEMPIDEESLGMISKLRDGDESSTGLRQELRSAGLVELGPSKHPAIEVRVRVLPRDDPGRAFVCRDYYTSTSGQKLILSFRTWENAESEADAIFHHMTGSVVFARPPQEPGERSSGLLWAIILGSITGLALLIASVLRRRTTPVV